MKHLLNGVAIAAALAIAAPVWAQAPMKSSTTPSAIGSPKASTTPMAGAPAASKQRAKRGTPRMAKSSAPGSMTDQLNREELARIQGGAAAGATPQSQRTSTTPAAIGTPKQP